MHLGIQKKPYTHLFANAIGAIACTQYEAIKQEIWSFKAFL
jgi:hypothetical protein